MDVFKDKLADDIWRYLAEHDETMYTAVELVNVFWNRNQATSRSKGYRKVMRRLQALHFEKLIERKYVNRFTPIKWYIP